MNADKNEKLSERSEFLSFPRTCAQRGNPDFSRDAKRRGGFSLVRFFVPYKEMNNYFFHYKELMDSGFLRND